VGADFVAVATDQRIADIVEGAGGRAVMTRSVHASGTDRLAEVAEQRDAPNVVKVVTESPSSSLTTTKRGCRRRSLPA
jgi:3-deoxy-manno-octulosonate cytidylyltransferase (CMP-KDO synthetase)